MLVIRALDTGGAERQLVELASELHSRGYPVYVVSFYSGGALARELHRRGVPLWEAGKQGRWDTARFALRIAKRIRHLRPEVVYSSMPPANLLMAVVKAIVGRPRLVWRLASSDMDLTRYDWLSRLSYRVEAALSKVPAAIVCNAEAGKRSAVSRGYPPDRIVVITNGVDACHYRPQPESGKTLRRVWGLDQSRWLIGLVAREDPKKDHRNFIRAAARLGRIRDDVRFLCVGVEPGIGLSELLDVAAQEGVADLIRFRAIETDLVPVYNALDINTLSSAFGEGFPNTVAESMACGVPCAVTDVGDSADIVGDTGEVARPASPDALASAWNRLLDRLSKDPKSLKTAARDRVVRNFSLERYVDKTVRTLYEVQ
ncbi:MAG: glycosyltransferase [Gammaproteobacteria bacterium]|nr:glycosyltransferase [Gammaproteobacteria bacterium]